MSQETNVYMKDCIWKGVKGVSGWKGKSWTKGVPECFCSGWMVSMQLRAKFPFTVFSFKIRPPHIQNMTGNAHMVNFLAPNQDLSHTSAILTKPCSTGEKPAWGPAVTRGILLQVLATHLRQLFLIAHLNISFCTWNPLLLTTSSAAKNEILLLY